MKKENIRPPQIITSPVYTHTLRFVANAAASAVPISAKQLLGAIGTVCSVSNSTVCAIASSCRVKKVSMWGPATGTIDNTLQLRWVGSTVDSKNYEVSDTSFSSATMSHVSGKPPKNTLASFWKNANFTDPLFLISCPQNTVIDVQVNFMLTDQAGSTTFSVATASLGFFYYLYLDNSGSNKFVPVGLVTTI